MTNTNLQAIVAGVGSLGKNHARVYAQTPGTDLAAVVDPDPAARKAAAEQWNCRALASLDEIDFPVDVASVVTPTVDHFPTASRLLRMGVHTLVEKPMTHTESEGEELIRIAETEGLVLQVGHIERFNPAVMALGGQLRRPLFIESHRLGPPAPRVRDIGVVLDLMIHDLDLILALVKSEPSSIDAVGVPVLTPREDIANARLRFESGCIANVTVSRVSPERQRKIRFFQSDAYLSLDLLKPELQIYRKIEREGLPPQIVREVPSLNAREPLAAEIESFILCVREKRPPAVGGRDGLAALRLAARITEQVEIVTDELVRKREMDRP